MVAALLFLGGSLTSPGVVGGSLACLKEPLALPWKTSGSLLTELPQLFFFFLNLKLLWMVEICEGVVC